MTDRHSLGPSLQGCNIVSIFCPYFCRRRKVGSFKVQKESEWELTEHELKRICSYLKIEDEEGFSTIFPHRLHQQWDDYILFDLFDTWVLYIYGNRDNILPDLKRFSELVKGQWAGTLEEKARIIFAILLRRSSDETGNKEMKIAKYDIVKYFFDLFATCLRGMGVRNNPELLMWMNCDAEVNEHKLQIAMKFFAEKLPEMADTADLRKLMDDHYILLDVLKSVIEMCFGIAPLTNRIVPFPSSSSRTILDIAHIVLLSGFIGGGVDLYEWEMLYTISKECCSWLTFEKSVVDKGPTILLLRDREDWIFGLYASSSWKLCNKFYGSGRSFLFRLYPTFKIFRPSFNDENFMYLNYGQEKLPTGLAMGGDLEHFGIWIDIDKPVGKCHKVCSTFLEYECLSAMSNFFYVDMEVWRVSPRIPCSLSRTSVKSLCHGGNECQWMNANDN